MVAPTRSTIDLPLQEGAERFESLGIVIPGQVSCSGEPFRVHGFTGFRVNNYLSGFSIFEAELVVVCEGAQHFFLIPRGWMSVHARMHGLGTDAVLFQSRTLHLNPKNLNPKP